GLDGWDGSGLRAHNRCSAGRVGEAARHALWSDRITRKDALMNPADIAQSALPLATDVSIFGLFWQAHWIVKAVMIGLLVCSIWVWAIALDKLLLYTRTRRAMDRFEQTFWSGQSLDELYRSLSARPSDSMASLFVAAMREWKR